jgi:hypothetical protein
MRNTSPSLSPFTRRRKVFPIYISVRGEHFSSSRLIWWPGITVDLRALRGKLVYFPSTIARCPLPSLTIARGRRCTGRQATRECRRYKLALGTWEFPTCASAQARSLDSAGGWGGGGGGGRDWERDARVQLGRFRQDLRSTWDHATDHRRQQRGKLAVSLRHT